MPALKWADAGRGNLLKPGHAVNAAEFLFGKIEDETIQNQIDKLLKTKTENAANNAVTEPFKADVSFDDFAKLDFRTGTIIAAEKVAKTKKLLKLLIDTGLDKRTVVSGIAEYYKPEDIVGQQVVVVANLTPKNLKGIDSKGMILMAEDANGKLVFVSPATVTVNGATVK